MYEPLISDARLISYSDFSTPCFLYCLNVSELVQQCRKSLMRYIGEGRTTHISIKRKAVVVLGSSQV